MIAIIQNKIHLHTTFGAWRKKAERVIVGQPALSASPVSKRRRKSKAKPSRTDYTIPVPSSVLLKDFQRKVAMSLPEVWIEGYDRPVDLRFENIMWAEYDPKTRKIAPFALAN